MTTREFLLNFGFDTLRDLPDIEALEGASVLSKDMLLARDILPSLSDDEMKAGVTGDE